MTLAHGGKLCQAARDFGIPLDSWIDLSTGISPWSWPVPRVPNRVWQRLPEDTERVNTTAAQYYDPKTCGAKVCRRNQALAVPGSQYAISRLPGLFPPGKAVLPLWGYSEHQKAWQQAGHQVLFYSHPLQLRHLVDDPTVQYAVVINPCNPTAELMSPDSLVNIAHSLAGRQGQLLVDEAFMDVSPAHSIIPQRPVNTIVLRSLGKFFGLAGLRLGFVIADAGLLARIAQDMDPWAVSHPALWLGEQALSDLVWQQQQRERLSQASAQWLNNLNALLPGKQLFATGLFASLRCTSEWGSRFYSAAAQSGVLVRLISSPQDQAIVRLGLPPERQWDITLARLQQAIDSLSRLPLATGIPR
ncbi:MAG: aminotransferase class I/II-fold pyridoxal phosphate-dependent enzyme [Porticoccaceae bacterium]|nr:aminotransferase class I/II-fold pyridoxal phosphate-dependent enzyme [Porticoccaceae bacterium]